MTVSFSYDYRRESYPLIGLVVIRRQCVFCPFEDSFFSFLRPSESSSNSVSFGHCWRLLVFADLLTPHYDVHG